MRRGKFFTRTFFFLLMLHVGAGVSLAEAAVPPVQGFLDRAGDMISSSLPPTQADYRKAITILTEGISAHPESKSLLQRRADLYMAIHDYDNALTDLNRADDIGPLTPIFGLTRCMLEERIEGYAGRAERCYDQVAREFEKEDDNRCPPDVNHVIAALMAQSHNADYLKNSYLKSTNKTDPMYDLVKNFDRGVYIKQILP